MTVTAAPRFGREISTAGAVSLISLNLVELFARSRVRVCLLRAPLPFFHSLKRFNDDWVMFLSFPPSFASLRLPAIYLIAVTAGDVSPWTKFLSPRASRPAGVAVFLPFGLVERGGPEGRSFLEGFTPRAGVSHLGSGEEGAGAGAGVGFFLSGLALLGERLW